ncbi:MAG: hypothetical protein Q4C62_03710 [Bacteroidales bacterium]|nr:hypothetical protein [Bacteroidales bacterium]
MKKYIFILVLLVSSVLGVRTMYITDDVYNLTSQNIEAIASGEIIIGPFCLVTSSICTQESDGFFIRGYAQLY